MKLTWSDASVFCICVGLCIRVYCLQAAYWSGKFLNDFCQVTGILW